MSDETKKEGGITSKEILDYKWKEYVLYIEHFRYYLEITLKTNIFFYVTTGGVVGFYLSTNINSQGTVKYFFLLPILVGTALTGMFIYGANLWRKAYVNAQRVKEVIEPKLSTKELPDTHLVFLYLWLSAIMFSIVGLSLAVLPAFSGDTSPKYLTSSILLAVVGLWLPRFAPKIDRQLKRERSLTNKKKLLGKFEQWEKIIQSRDFVPWACEETEQYDELSAFLSDETCEHIKNGTLTEEFLLNDIKRIKASIFKDDLKDSSSGQVQNNVSEEDSKELNSNKDGKDSGKPQI